MIFHAVGSRCTIDFSEWLLPITDDEALVILSSLGFKLIEVDPVTLAKSCIGKSVYRRNAKPTEAPGIVDCSSLMKWVYGQCGVWLPRRTIQQIKLGEPVPLNQTTAGDLIFVSGAMNYYDDDSTKGVGHVGMVTDDGYVIHAASKDLGVIQSDFGRFIGTREVRGVRRYIPRDRKVITLETPPEREVEWSDDIRWIIFQSLP